MDDDEETCAFFRSALEPEFSVLTAASAAEALDVLRAPGSRVGVVMSDQRMPGESGSTFLTKVRHEDPMTVRILTTAYSDLNAAIESVNQGSIYKYVVKPWNLGELRATVRQAMEYRMLRRERDLLLTEKLATTTTAGRSSFTRASRTDQASSSSCRTTRSRSSDCRSRRA